MMRIWEEREKEWVSMGKAWCPAQISLFRLVPLPQLPSVVVSNSSQTPFSLCHLAGKVTALPDPRPLPTHTPLSPQPSASGWLTQDTKVRGTLLCSVCSRIPVGWGWYGAPAEATFAQLLSLSARLPCSPSPKGTLHQWLVGEFPL